MADLPILVDGSSATELSRFVTENVDGHPLWSSRFLVSDKEAVIKIHREFLKAGVQIIRTNTYQAFADGFIQHMGIPREEATKPIADAVEFCRKAMELENRPDAIICGSVGPIGAWRGDGSEYTGDYCDSVTTKEFIDSHRHRVETLINSGVKLLCFETIPCSIEALALLDLLKEYPNVNAWLSFSCRNNKQISNGENFSHVAVECWKKGRDQLVAVGVNCLDPSWVSTLFEDLKKLDPKIPFIANANSGETYDAKIKEWVGRENAKLVSDFVPLWLEMGITYVGGCCRVNSQDIKAIGSVVSKWKEARQ